LNQPKYQDQSWPRIGNIEVKDLSLRYRPNTDLVLKKCSFHIHGGEKIGIVGRTGAGKSTICNALTRIVEKDSGLIKFDGIDISEINLR